LRRASSAFLDLPCCVELGISDFLTFQLDRELISHNIRVNELAQRANQLLFRFDKVREVVEGLKKEKTNLEARLLGRLEELKQALDDISKLQDDAASDQ